MKDKIHKTEEEWKKELTPEQYQVCRMKGTEPPFEIANNQRFDITEASQTADFEVKKPDRPAPDNKK